MTKDMVEAFLMILRYRNITAAAQRLYTSQTTVSHRLRMLEQEVGAQLFIRQRGHRVIEITPAGEEFAELAERWLALFRDMERLETGRARHDLTIGAPDLINTYTFVKFYRHLLVAHPEIGLTLQTYHSGELYRMVETRSIDLAYVYSQRSYKDVIATPLYRECMYVVYHHTAAHHSTISPAELPPDQEVYLRWSSEYAQWHDRYWPQGKSLVTVSTGDQMPLYLDVPGRWAIVPSSVCHALGNREGLSCHPLSENPPHLQCYEIRHRHPRQSVEPLTEMLRTEVREFVRMNAWLLDPGSPSEGG